MKINFAKVYNDFGKQLPETMDEFLQNSENEVTREMIRDRYRINSRTRGYKAFCDEYYAYVATLTTTKEKKDEAK